MHEREGPNTKHLTFDSAAVANGSQSDVDPTSNVAGMITLFGQAGVYVVPRSVLGTPRKVQALKRSRKDDEQKNSEMSMTSGSEVDQMQ